MQDLLIRLGACEEAREWVGSRTLAEAWAECARPNWMLWLHARSGAPDAAGYAALAKKWAAAAAAPTAAAAASAAEAAADEAAWAAARLRQCEDIRAALCCPVFSSDND